jgi:molybdopterin synthase catalytic subunit
MRLRVAIQAEDFSIEAETRLLLSGGGDCGAIASFTGLCRSENGQLTALELEHYPGMAEAQLQMLAEAAAARWPVDAITVIHRFGLIRAGENIVLVLVASGHRQAALDATSFVMDYLKTSAPFWKKEHRADGTASHWVAAKSADEDAAARWS